MKEEALKRIFELIEKKEGHRIPLKWKLINNIPLIEGDLNVKGSLDLDNTKITSLPEGLKVGGDLNLFDTKITSLPEGLEVPGFLNLSSCKKLTSLPKGLKVGGDLYIYGTPLTKYSYEELREMIKPGFIKGKIIR